MKKTMLLLFAFSCYCLFAGSQIQWVNYGASIYLDDADYARSTERAAFSYWNYIDKKVYFQVWDIPNSKKILEMANSPFVYFSLSIDGKTVAWWSWQDSVLTLWDVDNNAMKTQMKTDYYVNGLRFLDNDNLILNTVKDSSNYFTVFDSKTLNITKSCKVIMPDSTTTLNVNYYGQYFDFTPDGNYILIGAKDNKTINDSVYNKERIDTTKNCDLVIIDMNNCVSKFVPICNYGISDISVSKIKVNGNYLAAVLYKNHYLLIDTTYTKDSLKVDTIYHELGIDTSFIDILNIPDGQLLKQFTLKFDSTGSYSQIKFNDDASKLFMLMPYSKFSLFNLGSGQIENNKNFGGNPVFFCSYGINSFIYISGYQCNKYDFSQNQNTLLLNNYAGNMHIGGINGIGVTNDNKTVITSSTDGTMKYWNADDGSLLKTLNFPGINNFKISPDDSKIVLCTGSPNPVVQMINANTGEIIWTVSQYFHYTLISVAYSPDGNYIAVGPYADSIYVLKAATGEKVYAIDGGQWVNSVDFSTDNKFLAAGNENGGLNIVSMSDGRIIYFKDKYGQYSYNSPTIYSVKFSPDGKWLAAGFSDCYLRLLETTNWSVVSQFDCMIDGISYSYFPGVDFLSGSKYILGIDIAIVRAWDLQSHYNVFNYDAWYNAYYYEDFNVLAPSHDGKFIVTGTSYGTIIRWRGVDFLSVPDGTNDANSDIFPNPTSDKIYLNYTDNLQDNYSLTLYNSLGEKVSNSFFSYRIINNGKIELDCSNLESGIYYLNINNNGQIIHERFLVIK